MRMGKNWFVLDIVATLARPSFITYWPAALEELFS